MKHESETNGAEGSHSHPNQSSRVRTVLWVTIGALGGALLVGLGTQWREAGRLQQTRASLAGHFNRLLPKAEQQMAGIQQQQEELENELAGANAAVAAREIKLGLYRTLSKRVKAQIEQTEQTLRHLNQETTVALGGLKPSASAELLAEERQRQAELEQQLQQIRQDFSALEIRLEAASAYWAQLVLKEAEATRDTEVAKIRSEAAAEVRRAEQEARQVESNSILLVGALQRLEAETERARNESLRQTTLDTLRQVQSAAVPPLPPALCLQRPAYYSDAYYPYYDAYPATYRSYYEPYHLRNTYNPRYHLASPYYRYSRTWLYGSRPVPTYRFGPYLVVGN